MVTIKEASNIVIREALIKGGRAGEKDIAVIRLPLVCVGPQIDMDLGYKLVSNNTSTRQQQSTCSHLISVLGILGLPMPPFFFFFRISVDAGILYSRRVLD
jgi:hypothetical protein